MLKVFKIGGQIINDDKLLTKFLTLFSKIEGDKVLIHGGGKLASNLAEQLSIPVKMIDGRRITDEATLKVTVMTYAGWINTTLVGKLNALDCAAIGLTGADGNLIEAHKRIHQTIDYGFVGDIFGVKTNFLFRLINFGYLPVIAPITMDSSGQLLNTNADTIATEIAVACAVDKDVELYFIFDQPGLMRDIKDKTSLISTIKVSEVPNLKSEQIISDGMIPKIDNAVYGIQKRIRKVTFTNIDGLESILSGLIAGTKIIK